MRIRRQEEEEGMRPFILERSLPVDAVIVGFARKLANPFGAKIATNTAIAGMFALLESSYRATKHLAPPCT